MLSPFAINEKKNNNIKVYPSTHLKLYKQTKDMRCYRTLLFYVWPSLSTDQILPLSPRLDNGFYKVKRSKYSNRRPELVCHLITDNTEIF